MSKLRIGTLRNKLIVEGDINLLKGNEILLTEGDEYPTLRTRVGNKINTYVIVPLEDFNNKDNATKD